MVEPHDGKLLFGVVWPEHKLFVGVGEVEVDAVEVETRQLVDAVGAEGGVRLVGEQRVRPARA